VEDDGELTMAEGKVLRNPWTISWISAFVQPRQLFLQSSLVAQKRTCTMMR
jgi:hypothetical protein